MSDTAKPAAQVFAEGMSARSLGKAVTACPYAFGSEDHEASLPGQSGKPASGFFGRPSVDICSSPKNSFANPV
ncbi:hypothetical protein [Acidisphaera sp. L21]|uniref:hypothetical protein n=1 Tax=Acidisphaera sp. L21 TaxID=1641851 RepID=UPI00131D7281|nr:hypothetical protein [Acidisphaera sp. L21]